ncbi:MAG: hypothetical protein SWO11_17015 [Thermodesulfobacteriota bacterium]|nr:hypothetical protein [Thermodesulfobacteriota bacterium]
MEKEGKMRHNPYYNEYRRNRLYNGYDYDNQAWVMDGKYVRCGHPEAMPCDCYGRMHEGETPEPGTEEIRDQI